MASMEGGQTRIPSIPVIDCHVDLLYDLLRHHPHTPLMELSHSWVGLPKLAAGGVRVIVSVFYCPDACNGPTTAAAHYRFLLEYAGRFLQGLRTIRTAAELSSILHGAGPPGMILLLENADPLLEYPPRLLKADGFVAVGLTHACRNRIGDGNAVDDPEGLTPAGRELAAELDRLGFAIDTAHLSEPAFHEVAELFTGPLFSSHTGLRAFNDFPRNLSDAQIKTILQRDGVIGLAACPSLLSEDIRAGITDFFRQVDWFVQRYGAEGIGIGSDFGGYDTVCAGFNDHARIPDLAKMLISAGYPDDAVEGILGGNWFRFFSRLLSG